MLRRLVQSRQIGFFPTRPGALSHSFDYILSIFLVLPPVERPEGLGLDALWS